MYPPRQTTAGSGELYFEGKTNSLLRALLSVSEGWDDICERVTLKPGTIVAHGGTRPSMLHFPINCVVSDVASTLGSNLRHNEIQVAMHGQGDLVSFQALLSDSLSSRRSVVDHGDQAIRCQVEAARRLVREQEGALRLVLDYTALALDESAQLAACEVQLKVLDRVSAYLLQLVRLLGETVIPITHIRIGERLGIRRPSVTESLQALETAGVISQVDKGRVDVTNVDELEKRVGAAWPMLHQARQSFIDRVERMSA